MDLQQTLHVGNLPCIKDAVLRASLREAFQPFGEVLRIVTHPHSSRLRRVAFVTYPSSEPAQAAYLEMNGFLLHGSTIRVEMAKQEMNDRMLQIRKRNRGMNGVSGIEAAIAPTPMLLLFGVDPFLAEVLFRTAVGYEASGGCGRGNVAASYVKFRSVKDAELGRESIAGMRLPSGEKLRVCFGSFKRAGIL